MPTGTSADQRSDATWRRALMGTGFEVRLSGDDPEHLGAVASAMLDEVARVERLLSRFDGCSEISRINREAFARPVRLDFEVFGLLTRCAEAWQTTRGAFDITATAADLDGPEPSNGSHPTFALVCLDDRTRQVRFARPDVALDLGGVGKGYALDRAAAIARGYGVHSAILHGGTSSVLALGRDASHAPWRVGIRDPFVPAGEALELTQVLLEDASLSCSATFGGTPGRSDLVDPRLGRRLERAAACAVVAGSATVAEMLSTALLVLGREAGGELINDVENDGVSALWIESADARARWTWLKEPAT